MTFFSWFSSGWSFKQRRGDLLVSGGPDEVLTIQGEHAAHLPVVTRSTLLHQQEMEAHQQEMEAHQQEMETPS